MILEKRNTYLNFCNRVRNAINDAKINELPWYRKIFYLNYIRNKSYNFSWITAANYIRRCIENYKKNDEERLKIEVPMFNYKVSTLNEKLYNKNDIETCKSYCYLVLNYITGRFFIGY